MKLPPITPGPWSVFGGLVLADVRKDSGGSALVIADVRGGKNSPNARAIAQVPAMLELLALGFVAFKRNGTSVPESVFEQAEKVLLAAGCELEKPECQRLCPPDQELCNECKEPKRSAIDLVDWLTSETDWAVMSPKRREKLRQAADTITRLQAALEHIAEEGDAETSASVQLEGCKQIAREALRSSVGGE